MQFPERFVTMTLCFPYGDQPDKLFSLGGPFLSVFFGFLCFFFGLPKVINILSMAKKSK